MDWTDLNRTDKITVLMVSPTNLDLTLGELEDVDLSSTSLTYGYYTDTRVNGKLSTTGGNWIAGSFLRFIHTIPEWGYSNELATLTVGSNPASRSTGVWKTNYTLYSALKLLESDYTGSAMTLDVNASVLDATRRLLEGSARPYVINGANDTIVKSAVVFESSEAVLDRIFSLQSMANNRLDVDGHGRITINPYIRPIEKSSSFTLVLNDPQSIMEDDISRSSEWFDIPNRVVVSHKWTETVGEESVEREIVEYVDATGSNSAATRGYIMGAFYEVDEMEPKTAAQAQALAKSYLEGTNYDHIEWELTTRYLPITAGDVITLIFPTDEKGNEAYTGEHFCLVKSVGLNLDTMSMSLTIKDILTYDDDEE